MLCGGGTRQRAVRHEAEIRSVLSRQETAWNRGDTEGFLKGYDPKTVFVGDKIRAV